MSLLTNERWVRVRRVFEAVADAPAGDRVALLDDLCRDDDATREEVLALLEADATAPEVPADRAPALAAEPEAPFPEVLGFRIVRRLGTGGTGRVYEAICVENGGRVALKVIHAGASVSAMHRFRQESRVLARLDHPGIVRLYETGHTRDGQVYLATEFIDGGCIDRWREESCPSPRECVAMAVQVLDALSHAHAVGVVHRDIKPHNILVCRQGLAHLVDFGVARLSRDDGQRTGFRTETGNIVGTFAYMTPEQADGKFGRIGPATDVYQSALVLYELLAGRLPYEIEERGAMAMLRAVLFDRRIPLSEFRPSLAGPLEDVLSSALRIDPQERPQTARQFALALEAAAKQLS